MRLVCLAKIVDHQVRLEADLRDPSWEGSGVRFAHHLHPRAAADSSSRRYRDHSVQLLERLLQWRPPLQQHDLARADSTPGSGDRCSIFFKNSWALGWSRDR